MEDAKETLFKFFDEFYLWNIETYKYIQENRHKHESDLDYEELFSTAVPILKKYCTQKISDQIPQSCSDIPPYNKNELVLEGSEEMTRNKIAFYIREVKRTNFLYRYTLMRKNGVWLIDRKERFSISDNKWGKSYI